jgi:hypothetical protein
MHKSIEVLRLEEHKNFGIKTVSDFLLAKNLISAPITVNEYFESCKEYPIVFSKDSQGRWSSLAILGAEKENIFVDTEGTWKKNCHIPAFIGRYPFVFMEDKDNLVLTLDPSQKVQKSEAGENYFFEEDNSHSEFLKKLVSSMNSAHRFTKLTQEFIKTLNSLGLLEESGMKGKTAKGNDFSIGGFFVIKEEKLKALTAKELAKLCKKGYTQFITAHMISVSNIHKLIN